MGEILNKIKGYTALKELGRGGFGVAVLAVKDGKKYVVKKIKYTGNEYEEYLRMIDVKDKCQDYFVCVDDYMEYGGFSYIVMEYIDGYDILTNVLKTNLPIKITNNIILNICKAIKVKHRKDFAHNDLKPDKIKVEPNTGNVRLIDFGLACKKDKC